MALQKSTTTEQGVNASASYSKITNFNGDKDNIRFSVELFYNKEARDNNLEPLKYFTFQTSTPNTDLFPALYAHLKTLPEFSGAVDV